MQFCFHCRRSLYCVLPLLRVQWEPHRDIAVLWCTLWWFINITVSQHHTWYSQLCSAVWVWQYPVILWANPGLWWESRSCESGVCASGLYVLLSDVMWSCVKRREGSLLFLALCLQLQLSNIDFLCELCSGLEIRSFVQQIYKTKNRKKSVNECHIVQAEPLLLIAHEESIVK